MAKLIQTFNQLNGADGVANPMVAGGLIAALILRYPYNVLAGRAELKAVGVEKASFQVSGCGERQ